MSLAKPAATWSHQAGKRHPGRDGHRINLMEKFQRLHEENTVTVPSTLDAAGWLRNHLDGDVRDSDLARSMLQASRRR